MGYAKTYETINKITFVKEISSFDDFEAYKNSICESKEKFGK